MNWNSLRYCIGFPPEFWYDIADEEGILILDEFPIWLLDGETDGNPENPVAGKIIPEYIEWMRERWNHPCVVIWDGQNESATPESGKARDAVRHLELSNRPWDNGWGCPAGKVTHLSRTPICSVGRGMAAILNRKLRFSCAKSPELQTGHTCVPVRIPRVSPSSSTNTCWLWIDRQGGPTCLTETLYKSVLGPDSTADQRRRMHARYVAALTEFWRCHRQAAGVMHFCSLGYSRDGTQPRPEGGATSDDWIDVRGLRYEPHFEEFVKEAFAPVGLMLDFWADALKPGERRDLSVVMINDLPSVWSGKLRLPVFKEKEVVSEQIQEAAIAGYGDARETFAFASPAVPGEYTLEAALIVTGQPATRSLRDFRISDSE